MHQTQSIVTCVDVDVVVSFQTANNKHYIITVSVSSDTDGPQAHATASTILGRSRSDKDKLKRRSQEGPRAHTTASTILGRSRSDKDTLERRSQDGPRAHTTASTILGRSRSDKDKLERRSQEGPRAYTTARRMGKRQE